MNQFRQSLEELFKEAEMNQKIKDIEEQNYEEVLNRFVKNLEDKIIERKPEQIVYKKGWLNRIHRY